MKRRLKFKLLTLLALVPAVLLIYLGLQYMNVPAVDGVLRVVNLMGTLIHEGGHSLATLLTGGQLSEMVVNPNGSGYAMIGGGNTYLSLPAGYLGTTLLMALVFFINNRTRWGEAIPLLLGVACLWLTYVYGAKLAGGWTTYVVGYLSGAILVFMGIHPPIRIPGWRRIEMPDAVWMFWINLISMYYALGSVLSLEYLTRFAAHGNPDDVSVFTDTYYSWMDPKVMAAIWMGLSILAWVAVLIVIVRFYLRKDEAKA